ncbi:hypothetical protein [uncultured Celeribacter sp.]|uniref:hypothetical protein n=1 Tax=uncultured Celeribacter sp. TaxID=1303376 RepID=UPI002AA7667E|nr:hypothetical protein [uncultured Celeribacter sp.]
MHDQDEPALPPTPEEAVAALQRENAALEERLTQIGTLATRPGAEDQATIAVRLTNYENGFWKFVSRAGQILSPIAVLFAVLGFAVTTCSFTRQIDQISATTVYQLAREGRQLGRELESGAATTGEGINFHFSAQHLVDEGVVGEEMRVLYLVDYCGFMFDQTDFEAVWAELNNFYPESFSAQTDAILRLSGSEACTVDNLEALENGN